MWKAAVVLSGPVIAVSLFDADDLSFRVLAVLAVLIVVASVWGTSRLLGAHLGLRSWD